MAITFVLFFFFLILIKTAYSTKITIYGSAMTMVKSTLRFTTKTTSAWWYRNTTVPFLLFSFIFWFLFFCSGTRASYGSDGVHFSSFGERLASQTKLSLFSRSRCLKTVKQVAFIKWVVNVSLSLGLVVGLRRIDGEWHASDSKP